MRDVLRPLKHAPIAFVLAICAFTFPARAAAQDIRLAWDAPSDATVSGYRVHVGTQSGVYTQTFDVSVADTTFTFTTGVPGTTYYFAVKSFNASNVTSAFSNEVSAHINAPPVLASIANRTAPLGTALSFDVAALASDESAVNLGELHEAQLFHEVLERQVEIRGTASRVTAGEALRYFARRPRGSQLGAWVSAQSSVIGSQTPSSRTREQKPSQRRTWVEADGGSSGISSTRLPRFGFQPGAPKWNTWSIKSSRTGPSEVRWRVRCPEVALSASYGVRVSRIGSRSPPRSRYWCCR